MFRLQANKICVWMGCFDKDVGVPTYVMRLLKWMKEKWSSPNKHPVRTSPSYKKNSATEETEEIF